MNGGDYSGYFLGPEEHSHVRYEALRAFFVKGDSMKDVAQQFGVSYGAVRNWVTDFRRRHDAGQPPPFSFQRREVAPQEVNGSTISRKLPLPMLEPVRSKLERDS